jgi:hypothetical protein
VAGDTLGESAVEDNDVPDVDDVPEGDDDLPDTAGDPAPPVLAAGAAAAWFPLPGDKTDGTLMCAAGATDRSTVAAVAGVKNTKARKAVIRTVGISSSCLIGTFMLSSFPPRKGEGKFRRLRVDDQ